MFFIAQQLKAMAQLNNNGNMIIRQNGNSKYHSIVDLFIIYIQHPHVNRRVTALEPMDTERTIKNMLGRIKNC